jgi:nucleotide-binding universal stress UspA family protein
VKTQISTILLATDFMQSSRMALDYALLLAHSFGAHLVIINAFELGPEASSVEMVDHVPSRTRKEATARLQAFVSGCSRAGVSTDSALVEGAVPDAVLNAVRNFKADLLMMGTQGVHRGLGHLLIGSNTEALMLRSPCPTLTIGPHVLAGVNLDGCFKKIVYISNFKLASAAAAPFAVQLSQVLASRIEIYQVVKTQELKENPAQLQGIAEEYCSQLRSFVPDISEEWCDPEFQLKQIITPEEVLQKSLDPSVLMVVGAHSAPTLERHLHTSYPYRLLANAACPIITVRSEGNGSRM